ncbi:MAG TPA: hypothetical protein ENJ82_15225, partial [Bacteroidetes bacterium]|nr:hypothetical protein [Bacteroidota bacterium]
MSNTTSYSARKWIRILWTLFTYPFGLPAAVVGALIGGAGGLVVGIRYRRGAIFGARSGLQRGAIRAVRMVFAGSTWLYRKLFIRKKEKTELPSFSAPAQDILIIGHRGAPYKKVENTLSSFAYALSEGANALETDLCITSDGQVVLWHDWNPDSATAKYRESGLEPNQRYRPYYPKHPDRKRVSDLTLEELRSNFGYAYKNGAAIPARRFWRDIPTFDTFIRWASRQAALNTVFLDIKIPENELEQVAHMIAGIRKTLKAHPISCKLVILCPVQPVVDEFIRLAPDMEMCFDQEVIDALPTATTAEAKTFSAMRPAEAYGNQFASVGRPTTFTLAPFEVYQKIIQGDIQYRHQQCLGIHLIAWTINDPTEMAALVALGVDGILTDHPHRLARIVNKQEAFDVLRNAREWLGIH